MIFKLLNSAPLLIIIYFLLGMNIRLYYSPAIKEGINTDLFEQLQYLRSRREHGAAKEMQQLFPEGLLFFECLYGLAWADFISHMDRNSEISKQGKVEIEKCLKNINSPSSMEIFQEDLKLKNGAFFSGWSNYLLGRKLEISEESERSIAEINKFKTNCIKISESLKNSETPYLESYTHNCWPADVIICVASLALHDRVFEKKYDRLIENWIEKVKNRLDIHGLIPHSVNYKSGIPLENARGESQSLILSFLPEIDSAFSKLQYLRFKGLFVEKRLGLNAIREYPKGIEGQGDIDSGPVIWGIGTAATIVAQRAAQNNGDFTLANQIQNGIEAFGFPKVNGEGKFYLNGYLDMGDVFIAWTRSTEIKQNSKSNSWWQFSFHFWSLLIILPLFYFLFQIWKNPKKRIGKPNNFQRSNFRDSV